MMPYYLYTMLQLKDPEVWGLVKKESVDRVMEKIKEITQTNAISNIIFQPQSDRIKLLRNRRSIATVSKKPVNKPAEVC